MKILVVEDDLQTARYVRKGLREAGFAVEHAEDGEEGLDCLLASDYDAAVVDIMLPYRDGLSVIQHLRAQERTTPVLILSAKGTVNDRVQGLQSGGDDYLVKPFAFSELLARLQALIRRSQSIPEPSNFQFADLTLDACRRRVTRGETEIELQPREFELLMYLMQHPNRVVSKTMIMEHVWDYNFDPQTNVVEARVCRLREKIDRPFDHKLIHTVRGVGYILRE